MHELKHEFTDRKISPWGGIKYFQQVFVRSGIRDYISSVDGLPQPGSNRGYQTIDLIEGFLTSVILGARRLEHCGMLRTDEVIRQIYGWQKGMGSASTFQRFFHKFDDGLNAKLFWPIMKFVLSRVAIGFMTIDLDSSVIPRYGKQQKAEVGYNPKKRGRPSHHPLMAFCEELKMVVNGWMRSGKTQSSTNAIEFLEEVLQIVGENNVGLLRGDVGFYSHRIMNFLEQRAKPIPYLFKVRMTTGVQKKILEQQRWHNCDDVVKGAIYSEIQYKSSGWKNSRRVIITGIPKKEKTSNSGWLFSEYELMDRYEFHAFVTNATYSMVEIHRKYNQRGDSENRIKELKYDYAIDAFAMKSFAATDAAFRFVLLAYNIMTIFKQAMMQPRVNHRLSTVKFQCVAIGSYLVSSGRKKILKLSAEGKRRHFLEHIFKNVSSISPPYTFSIA
jgi:hypothetical protein